MAKSVILFAPESYWNLSSAAKGEIVNGCGSAQARFDFVPDRILGLNITQACNIHDYMYYIAEPLISYKEEADRVFLNNMLRIINECTKSKLLRWARRRIAKRYYIAVKFFGGSAFWNGKNGAGTFKNVEIE